MDLVQQIIARAKSDKQRIVLPEATEERTLKAADMALADEIADIILIGNPEEINRLAGEWGLKNIGKATIIDPENNPKAEEYAALLAELRKKKGMTIEQARELVKNPLYLGCMIIKTGGADGQIRAPSAPRQTRSVRLCKSSSASLASHVSAARCCSSQSRNSMARTAFW